MSKAENEDLFLEEFNRIINLLSECEVSEKKIKILHPVIENTAWMKVKLDESRESVKNSKVVITYDNGGGQKGIRENPIFKGYEALWKSYMSGMNVIINSLPAEVVEKEKERANENKNVLELVMAKHKKQA